MIFLQILDLLVFAIIAVFGSIGKDIGLLVFRHHRFLQHRQDLDFLVFIGINMVLKRIYH
jgi:hypothetical protein